MDMNNKIINVKNERLKIYEMMKEEFTYNK